MSGRYGMQSKERGTKGNYGQSSDSLGPLGKPQKWYSTDYGFPNAGLPQPKNPGTRKAGVPGGKPSNTMGGYAAGGDDLGPLGKAEKSWTKYSGNKTPNPSTGPTYTPVNVSSRGNMGFASGKTRGGLGGCEYDPAGFGPLGKSQNPKRP